MIRSRISRDHEKRVPRAIDGTQLVIDRFIHDFDVTPVLAAKLRELRRKRGLSLERLSRASGVSRAMLGQIELGQSVPSVATIWKIARALDVALATLFGESRPPKAKLVKRDSARVLAAPGGTLAARSLLPSDRRAPFELSELRLEARASDLAEARPHGTCGHVVVASGRAELEVGGRVFALDAGDALWFEAHAPCLFRNPADVECVMYLILSA